MHLILGIVERCSHFYPDPKSRYGTAMYSCGDDITITFRPVHFRDTKAIMLHSIEADEPSKGAWKKFWSNCIEAQPTIKEAGFDYVIIDCILEPFFEKHIAKTWELVKPYELPDPSTYIGTYCWKIKGSHNE